MVAGRVVCVGRWGGRGDVGLLVGKRERKGGGLEGKHTQAYFCLFEGHGMAAAAAAAAGRRDGCVFLPS